MVYEGISVQPLETFERAVSVLTNSQASQQQNEVLKSKAVKWEPPPFDYYELNADEVLFFDFKKSGIRCVVCDHRGKVLLAASLTEKNVPDPKTIEVLASSMALLRSLQLCMHQGFQNLIIESDCSPLVEEVLSQQAPNSILGNILLDIGNLMLHFLSCKLQYGSWKCNYAA